LLSQEKKNIKSNFFLQNNKELKENACFALLCKTTATKRLGYKKSKFLSILLLKQIFFNFFKKLEKKQRQYNFLLLFRYLKKQNVYYLRQRKNSER